MVKVRLDREYYQHYLEMINWCKDNISENFGWHKNLKNNKYDWAIEMNFGYQTYTFKNDEDAVLFQLRWL